MDPGDESYLVHLLAMTKAVISHVNSSVGLCIDRQDMVGRLNPHADDGVTWFESTSQQLAGGTARNTIFSFLEATRAMSTELRSVGKGIFINVHTSRLDMMKYIDGMFDEHVSQLNGVALNTTC